MPVAFLAGMHDAAVITEFAGHQQGLPVDLTALGCSGCLAGRCPS
ncbi:MAG: hypothetical protein ACRDST_04475 [Pseudonocardiaceae bacterium]